MGNRLDEMKHASEEVKASHATDEENPIANTGPTSGNQDGQRPKRVRNNDSQKSNPYVYYGTAKRQKKQHANGAAVDCTATLAWINDQQKSKLLILIEDAELRKKDLECLTQEFEKDSSQKYLTDSISFIDSIIINCYLSMLKPNTEYNADSQCRDLLHAIVERPPRRQKGLG